jgi:dienelactone hydrolase
MREYQKIMPIFLKMFMYIALITTLIAGSFTIYILYFQKPLYFPKPTGLYTVGTTTIHATIHAQEASAQTEYAPLLCDLMLKSWYPAEQTGDSYTLTPYAPQLTSYYKKNNLLAYLLLYNRAIFCYEKSYAPVALTKKSYPVIIFSHGLGSLYDANTAYCEELASNGYVVISIAHPHDSEIIFYPDGTKRQASSEIHRKGPWDITHIDIQQRLDDVTFTLDYITQLNNNPESFFYNKLDLTTIGICGHSFGGITAFHACQKDPRLRCGINIDGPFAKTNMQNYTLTKPFMFILQDNYRDFITATDTKTKQEQEQYLKNNYIPGIQNMLASVHNIAAPAYIVTIYNTHHYGFSDLAILQHHTLAEYIPFLTIGSNSICQVNKYLVAFFDRYLKQQPSPLLDPAQNPCDKKSCLKKF